MNHTSGLGTSTSVWASGWGHNDRLQWAYDYSGTLLTKRKGDH